jgi:ATP-dependent DNA helicase RecG
MSFFLEQDIKFIKGVGPSKAEVLSSEASIDTVKDLLEYYPYRYIDRTEFQSVASVNQNTGYVQLKGRFTSLQTIGDKFRQRLVGRFSDGTGSIEMVWFASIKAIKELISAENIYVAYGKLTEFGGKINLVHPDFEKLEDFENEAAGRFYPLYPTTEKMKKAGINSKAISRIIKNTLVNFKQQEIPETLSAGIISACKLIGRKESISKIHYPESTDDQHNAELRIKFEELFYIQLNMLKRKQNSKVLSRGFVFHCVGDSFLDFYKNKLPFELTQAQKRVVKEVRQDTLTGKHMNRLVQGDVGSGKTLVALLSMLLAIDNGYQACFMAPTEILAQQHFESLSSLLGKSEISLALLTGSTKKKDRVAILAGLEAGSLHIVVGTHAVLEDSVVFSNLGIAVIDEQHRFGVAQRAKLWAKNTVPPHILVMTATPIPRTLAMTLYGDLDISVIDELPPGRKPIKTLHYFDNKRLVLFGFIKEQIKLGRQVYIVYPLINESEKLDLKDLQDGYESISRAFPPPEYQVAVVHGKMKAADKEISMKQFVEGKAQIMVATTVIEVGVNVPNASVMVIENAERFGLSQLHQLRGRVGRGADQSYCILMSSYKLGEDGKKRMQTMVESNDGFVIAEADLKLRGPGDIEGTQQSGQGVNLKMANLAKDGQVLQLARNIAESVLETDPNLEQPGNLVLGSVLKRIFSADYEWRKIS